MQAIFFIFAITTAILVQYTTKAQQETIVRVRIEGDENTMFESWILTRGKKVTTPSGGTHTCDGTNNNASLIPGPTMTSSLDLAANKDGLGWDGKFYELYDDYFITRIGNTSQTKSQFWSSLLNYNFTQVGGCQQKVIDGDDLLFAFDGYNKAHFLKLETSQETIKTGDSLTVTVTDARTGEPIEGATVGSIKTNIFGRATLTFNNLGAQILKAERSDSIRSNGIMITVTA